MKYFLDTEFIEGFHKPLFGRRRHFIDLLSIGIVCEDGREYYAVSNNINLKKADDWVISNVVKPLYNELQQADWNQHKFRPGYEGYGEYSPKNFRRITRQYGKSNQQIANEVEDFTSRFSVMDQKGNSVDPNNERMEIYAYFADYDWVLFCSLFGRMVDLPRRYPQYCKDLKQILDSKISVPVGLKEANTGKQVTFDDVLGQFIKREDFPKQKNEHNALADAHWNKKLFEFLKSPSL